MSSFVVIDFETANPSRSSICQIGMVKYVDCLPVNTFGTYVNPEEEFSIYNINVHGITQDIVKDAPKFNEIYPDIIDFIGDNIILSHSLFDSQCMKKVIEKYELFNIENTWIDAIELLKRTLPQFADTGYKLQSLAQQFSLETKAHDALNDAYICGLIVNRSLEESNTRLEDWIDDLKKHPSAPFTYGYHAKSKVKREPNSKGEYFGRSIVFTGVLSSVERAEAEDLANDHGFEIKSSVTKKVNYLVVGIQDLVATKGNERSTKELTADKLIAQGVDLKILNEVEFLQMCGKCE